MSTRLRFNAAQQVFEAFPRVASGIALRPTEGESPIDFARRLLSSTGGFDPIVFIASVLPRREAVWWACQCIRAVNGGKTDDALAAAEAWVRKPEEAERRMALQVGTSGDTDVPTTWFALAAGHSGGSVAPEDAPPVHAWSEATAMNLKAGIILAIVRRPMAEIQAWIRACVEAGIRFAEGGEAKVTPPAIARSGSGS
jgi:hypothetical protein